MTTIIKKKFEFCWANNNYFYFRLITALILKQTLPNLVTFSKNYLATN